MVFMPDSPARLISKGRDDEAREALRRLRGSEYSNLEKEFGETKIRVQEAANNEYVSLTELFTSSVYLKPLIIASGLMACQQLSGINEVLFYLSEVFIKAGSDLDSGLSAFIVTLAQMLATGVAVLIVEKLGRRILLIASAAFMCISICGLGVYFHLDENQGSGGVGRDTVESLGWLPLVCLIVYVIAFSIGLGPLAWAMNVELFPREAQSVMASLTTGMNWMLAFIVSKFSRNLEEVIHTSGLYFMFCGICGIAVLFIIFFVPETRGKTPEDMKSYFQGSKKK